MRKLPIGPLSYQVWYIDNPDNPAERWRNVPATSLAHAYIVLDSLVKDGKDRGVEASKYYIIEFRGKIIGEQDLEYPQSF